MSGLSEERLADLRKDLGTIKLPIRGGRAYFGNEPPSPTECALIAAMYEVVPLLLAEVDRLRAENNWLHEELEAAKHIVSQAEKIAPGLAALAGRMALEPCSHEREVDRLRTENERLREELMRCGLLAVSERVDGCISKTTALRIRANVHRACWPDDSDSSGEESDG